MSTHFLLAAVFSLFFVTGCYRMPEDGEVSVLPTTNNPAMTRQGGGWTPGVEY
jgi:hypothetical protein